MNRRREGSGTHRLADLDSREGSLMTIMTGRAGSWRDSGACLRADPDLFFPISAVGRGVDQIARAKAICARCPVRQECLDFAYAHAPVHGVWGGTTLEERQRARRRDPAA